VRAWTQSNSILSVRAGLNDIGSEFDASKQYASGSHMQFQAGVGHFRPGP
jgi:hypothetical protein